MIIHNDLVGTRVWLLARATRLVCNFFFLFFFSIRMCQPRVKHDLFVTAATPLSAGCFTGILATELNRSWYKPRDRPWGCISSCIFFSLPPFFCFFVCFCFGVSVLDTYNLGSLRWFVLVAGGWAEDVIGALLSSCLEMSDAPSMRHDVQ